MTDEIDVSHEAPMRSTFTSILNRVPRSAPSLGEAQRDAVVAVALAIKRRGGDPVNGWTPKDGETAFAIADMLVELGKVS